MKATPPALLPPPTDYAQMLTEWTWLLGSTDRFRAVAMTCFGDWFLSDTAGAVWFLDATSAELTPAASSRAEFDRLCRQPERQEHWLMQGLVNALHDGGVRLGQGECYGWKVSPSLGAPMNMANIEVVPLPVYTAIASQMGQAARTRAGERVGEITVDGRRPDEASPS